MPKQLKLRRLHRGEKQKLEHKARDRKLSAGIALRYRLISLVYAGHNVLTVARRLNCAQETAYHWVHEFNQHGFQHFERPPNPSGRPSQITRPHLRMLLSIAQKRPTEV